MCTNDTDGGMVSEMARASSRKRKLTERYADKDGDDDDNNGGINNGGGGTRSLNLIQTKQKLQQRPTQQYKLLKPKVSVMTISECSDKYEFIPYCIIFAD